jgi:spore maturation protein CgeB
MTIVILGLAITSSWGNGHATTYRALVRALASRGHDVLFLERDATWYAENRDLPRPTYCEVSLYRDRDELERRHGQDLEAADLVILGSYVPDGIAVADTVLRRARGCTAFYDIDTPVTVAALHNNSAQYLAPRQVAAFDLYLSFTGGPMLQRLERQFGAQRARALYCSVDAEMYFEERAVEQDVDLGYLGTYSADRQPTLDELLIRPARAWAEGRFVIAGAQYPATVVTPANVERITHLAPVEHRAFYNRQRFTLNVTRRDMIEAGYSPSVRLFEAAACGTAIISDDWPGLETVLTPGVEILLARNAGEMLGYLRAMPEEARRAIGARARSRVLESHTSVHRAIELERYVAEASDSRPSALPAGAGDVEARLA